MTNIVPNPGSDEAIKLGCTCPVLDNEYGKGFPIDGQTCFWYTSDCPVHSSKKEDLSDSSAPIMLDNEAVQSLQKQLQQANEDAERLYDTLNYIINEEPTGLNETIYDEGKTNLKAHEERIT